HISFSSNFIIHTDTNGFFDTQIGLPAVSSDGRAGVGYFVSATNSNGLVGSSTVTVLPGITNFCNVTLLDKGALRVIFRQANGTPATNALVAVAQGGFPGDTGGPLATDTNGTHTFQDLFEGIYAVDAAFVSGPTTLFGRAGASVVANQTNSVTITLGPTATI